MYSEVLGCNGIQLFGALTYKKIIYYTSEFFMNSFTLILFM